VADADPTAFDTLLGLAPRPSADTHPTQTVALACGLQPGSIKRVIRARELGYLREASKGRSGGLANHLPA
jgi:hypothetical protein